MESVIITGADGFVGSYTVAYFLSQGKRVLALDLRTEPLRLKPHAGLTYRCCDISRPQEILSCAEGGEYDTFIHLAWVGLTGAKRADYEAQIANAITALDCMRIAKELGCTRYVCAGSIMEYELEAAVHDQGRRPGAAYTYAIGKQMAHALCKIKASEMGIDMVWPMITNAYGEGEFSERFIITTLRKIINGAPLQFTSAMQNYDFVYVTDVARALYLVAERGRPFCEYMIGSGHAKPLRQFIVEMLKACDAKTPPLFGDVPFTGTILPLSTFSIDAIREDCGFEPEISFADGVRRTYEWLVSVKSKK